MIERYVHVMERDWLEDVSEVCEGYLIVDVELIWYLSLCAAINSPTVCERVG